MGAHSRTSETIESCAGDASEGDSGLLAAFPGESACALTGLETSTDKGARELPILGSGSREVLMGDGDLLDEAGLAAGESGTSKTSSTSAAPADATTLRPSTSSFSSCCSSFSATVTAPAEGVGSAAILSSGGGLLRLQKVLRRVCQRATTSLRHASCGKASLIARSSIRLGSAASAGAECEEE